ncbi:DNA topoisomerase IB [Rhizobium sp. RU36D]|uniref:DNA topoisomerase IB n=1 Tax=Rhizobium sp. RU36D TaxID=1907415 RepID=UPI0009D8421F|nr:DNA topoisomerase IB [Rhizobium sp. RU36D]SMC73186.1 DNA topoisomerase-1 [Rhizobium sp. RU36D]
MSTLEDKIQFAVLKKAGLIYVSDQEPGISRERRGKNFCYRLPSGDLLTDPEVRTRIKSLGLPPAYDNVWICLKENGHLQATGLDARGRKQYRYHNDWHMLRDEKKFDELSAFGQALPVIRRRAARDLERHADPQCLTLAALVLLLDTSYLRVGNKTYRDTNGTYGATTLLKKHVRFGADLELRFAAKGGRKIRRRLQAPKLQKVLERIAGLPGRELFVWQDNAGQLHSVDAGHLNRYLGEIGEGGFSAKTFRTWGGTLAAFSRAMAEIKQGQAPTVKALTHAASEELFNTPAVCRKSYIHPSVLSLATDASRAEILAAQLRVSAAAIRGLSASERRLLAYLNAG